MFIVACGTTHFISIWTLWNLDYGWEALIKVVTAIASVRTAIVLWPLIPKALAIPSPLQLKEANAALGERVRERDEALALLRREIAERERADAALWSRRRRWRRWDSSPAASPMISTIFFRLSQDRSS